MKKIIIILISILVVFYFGLKLSFLLKYPNNPELTNDYLNYMRIKDTITINKQALNENESYLQLLDNVKIKNDFEDAKLISPTSDNNTRLYSNDDKNQTILIHKTNDILTDLKTNGISTNINAEDTIKFFKENNINSDIDLYKYLNNIKDIKNNIFTSIKDMRTNHINQIILRNGLSKVNELTLIEGDYYGCIPYTQEANDSITRCLAI